MQFPNRSTFIASQKGWSNQEIAEFYRVVDVLRKAGLQVEVDSGETDEGDPWFVFLRPDTSEVVAHFARIGSEFIAVSGLNKDLYKGRDIRSVVSRMLQSHPVLLPQEEGAGRIYLHPSAALTAFVAAALLLSIDGAGAHSVKQVIEVLTVSNAEQLFSNEDQKTFLFKEISYRSPGIDLTLAGYNVATLGAALFPTEINQSDNSLNFQETFVEDKSESVDLYLETNVISDRSMRQERADAADNLTNKSNHLVQAQAEFSSVAEGEQMREAFSEEVEIGDEDIISDLDTVSEIIDLESSDRLNDVAVWSELPSIDAGGELRLSPPSEPSLVFGGSIVSADSKQIPGDTLSDEGSSDELNVSGLLENVYSVFEKVVNGNQITDANLSGPIGLGFDLVGDFFVFDTENSDQIIFSEMNNEPVKYNKIFEADDLLYSNGMQLEGDRSGETTIIEPPINQNTDAIKYSLPLIGHNVSALGLNVLELSSAKDVVFYSGGEETVSGFELGKDLLWFFLEPSDLEKVEARVEGDTDLLLQFGEIGTLKLTGVLWSLEDNGIF
jgi:hypothetical protein